MQEPHKRKQRMIRKQVFITEEQNRRLKAEAARLGVAEADLVRAGIDLRLAQELHHDDWKSALERISGAWAERENLDEEMKAIRSRWSRRREILRKGSGKA
jgi:hypothetical protein